MRSAGTLETEVCLLWSLCSHLVIFYAKNFGRVTAWAPLITFIVFARQTVMKDRIVDWCHSCDLVLKRLLLGQLELLTLIQSLVTIDDSSFFRYLTLLVDILTYDVLFMEILGPPLRNPILHFILDCVLVGTFGECSCQ